jgi:hypothetical protein
MAPAANKAAQLQRNSRQTQHRQQQQQQEQQQQQQPPTDDELLEPAPPAFPQPVSSLPRSANQHYQYPASAFAAAATTTFPPNSGSNLPVSSSAASYAAPGTQQQQQQQQQQQWPPEGPFQGTSAVLQPGGLGQHAGAAAASSYGYTMEGLPLPYGM